MEYAFLSHFTSQYRKKQSASAEESMDPLQSLKKICFSPQTNSCSQMQTQSAGFLLEKKLLMFFGGRDIKGWDIVIEKQCSVKTILFEKTYSRILN